MSKPWQTDDPGAAGKRAYEEAVREAEQSVCSEKFRLSAEEVRDLIGFLRLHSNDWVTAKACLKLFENAKYVEVGK